MKVKVKQIAPPYTEVTTESLQAVMLNHAHGKLKVHISEDQLFAILNELVRRRETAGSPCRTTEAAWAEFVAQYMPTDESR